MWHTLMVICILKGDSFLIACERLSNNKPLVGWKDL